MNAELLAIQEQNIENAWARSFLALMEPGVTEITPLVATVSIAEMNGTQDRSEIRSAIDTCVCQLRRSHSKLQETHTVANTIFPQSLWNLGSDKDGELLYRRFATAWPQIKRCSQNRRGSYFRRLTAFRPDGQEEPINQLKHIVATYKAGNHRRSALQASIFDPALDHTNSRLLGFPCLHQVAFAPIGDDGLSITGFYATQYVFDRAFGNYLGLCRLGRFMAKMLGLRLVRMSCVASIAQLGTPGKGELRSLEHTVKKLIEGNSGAKE